MNRMEAVEDVLLELSRMQREAGVVVIAPRPVTPLVERRKEVKK